MKLNVLALALAATAFGSLAANAQTTTTVIEHRATPPVVIEHRTTPPVVVEERAAPPPVVVEQPAPPPASAVTVDERGGFLGTEHKRTTIETNSTGDCQTKTVHHDDLLGERTVKRTNCY